MVSEMPSQTAIDTSDVFIPEFGLFDMMYLEEDKKYQGRVYRLSTEATKAVSEALGFTARFESASIRNCYIDMVKTEGHIVFEIDRNTKPTDLNLRYMRDRWGSAEQDKTQDKGAEALKPWIKHLYETRYLQEKLFQALAPHLRLKVEHFEHFYVRVNLKEKTLGLIAEDKYIEEFPTQAFQIFALPEGHVPNMSGIEVEAESAPAAKRPAPSPVQSSSYTGGGADSGAKYATYSMSEIDKMFKMQAENISKNLSAKMGNQQRIFQEAVAGQEKSFKKLADRFVTEFEEARIKLDGSTGKAHEKSKEDLSEFVDKLSKELSDFKAHVNKNIVPISKNIDKKVESLEEAAGEMGEEGVKPLIMAAIVLIVISLAINGFTLYKLFEAPATTAPVAQSADK